MKSAFKFSELQNKFGIWCKVSDEPIRKKIVFRMNIIKIGRVLWLSGPPWCRVGAKLPVHIIASGVTVSGVFQTSPWKFLKSNNYQLFFNLAAFLWQDDIALKHQLNKTAVQILNREYRYNKNYLTIKQHNSK